MGDRHTAASGRSAVLAYAVSPTPGSRGGTRRHGRGRVLLPHSPAGLRELRAERRPDRAVVALAAWILLTPALFPGTVLAAGRRPGLRRRRRRGACARRRARRRPGGLRPGAHRARGAGSGSSARSARLARIDALLRRRGFAAILAARLMPGVPARGLHYVAGASRVRPPPSPPPWPSARSCDRPLRRARHGPGLRLDPHARRRRKLDRARRPRFRRARPPIRLAPGPRLTTASPAAGSPAGRARHGWERGRAAKKTIKLCDQI